ncbi:hypothetical protein LBMAG56_10600 [Verrucomicrobiota bacterium]|nr:hypothetical protein LBMAG56_10600 [Verrucomicrobiota bacterium]
MSQDFKEGRLTFSFPDSWSVCRPGETLYYASRFQLFCGGCKEADFAAYAADTGKLWLVEVKDHAAHPRTKPVPLPQELAEKVRDTLALLAAAAVSDPTPSTTPVMQAGDFARLARGATSLNVVLHCEPQPRPSTLFPAVSQMANLLHELRTALRAVDANVRLASKGTYSGLPWAVS